MDRFCCFLHEKSWHRASITYDVCMVQVVFTPNIQRHVLCPLANVQGATVGEVLDRVFANNRQARGYVLDDQGALRKHMIIFIDGRAIADRAKLSDPVNPTSKVAVYQALSGG